MRLFFRNIPANTSPKELTRYIKPSLDRGVFNLFKSRRKITKIDILAQIDPDSNVVRHHGLVTIKPDKAAKRTMKLLNKIPFNGKSIFILEFINRSKKNDRRTYSPEKESLPNNRRKTERRQHVLEKVTHIGVEFSGHPQFARKFG